MVIEEIGLAAPSETFQGPGVRKRKGRFALVLERESTPRAFIYNGFSRARDSLTHADCVAYGLHSQPRPTSDPVQPVRFQGPSPDGKPALEPASVSADASSANKSGAAHAANKCWLRALYVGSQTVLRVRTAPATFDGPAGVLNPKWYRLDFHVAGNAVRCLVFRGRTFVSSNSHTPKRRERSS